MLNYCKITIQYGTHTGLGQITFQISTDIKSEPYYIPKYQLYGKMTKKSERIGIIWHAFRKKTLKKLKKIEHFKRILLR